MPCNLLRGNQRGLLVDAEDGKDPRPDPDVSSTPVEALALAAASATTALRCSIGAMPTRGPPTGRRCAPTALKPSASPPTSACERRGVPAQLLSDQVDPDRAEALIGSRAGTRRGDRVIMTPHCRRTALVSCSEEERSPPRFHWAVVWTTGTTQKGLRIPDDDKSSVLLPDSRLSVAERSCGVCFSDRAKSRAAQSAF